MFLLVFWYFLLHGQTKWKRHLKKNQRPRKKKRKCAQNHTKQHETTLIMLGCETRIILSCRFVFLVDIFVTIKDAYNQHFWIGQSLLTTGKKRFKILGKILLTYWCLLIRLLKTLQGFFFKQWLDCRAASKYVFPMFKKKIISTWIRCYFLGWAPWKMLWHNQEFPSLATWPLYRRHMLDMWEELGLQHHFYRSP